MKIDWQDREKARQVLATEYDIKMWSEEKINAFRDVLLNWFDQEGRDLPWRGERNGYQTWVSEIMLQQTQVVTVIPYYERFMEWFPTVEALAKASEDKLLKAWEGLGYYSRVRNMQAAANQILDDYEGLFPETYDELIKLKGVGPYTAAAIASMTFGEAVPAIDGNLMRVMSRLFEVDYDIAIPSTKKIFDLIGICLIDPERPGDWNQAMMDLGASYERAKNPLSDQSPIRDFNAAYQNGTVDIYPIKSRKNKPVDLNYIAFAVENADGKWLVKKRPEKGLLAKLWTFPMILKNHYPETEVSHGQANLLEETPYPPLATYLNDALSEEHPLLDLDQPKISGKLSHTFSHQRWHLQLIHYKIKGEEMVWLENNQSYEWMAMEDFDKYAWPTVQMKLWQSLDQAKSLPFDL